MVVNFGLIFLWKLKLFYNQAAPAAFLKRGFSVETKFLNLDIIIKIATLILTAGI